ncbi:MAG: COG4315 family predicted lipoprotein [Candidatus Saccharimonadales bacterium]
MKRAIIGLIVIIILVVGGILIFHKSPSKTTNNSGTSSQNSSNTPAANNSIVLTKTSSSLGQYLTDPSGKPLYTYNADTSGVSNCTGSCLTNWPPYVATASTTNLPSGVSTITRSDTHQVQYTYNGLPLYYFTSDTVGGQPTGNGVQNFAIATPSTTAPSSSNPGSSGNPY